MGITVTLGVFTIFVVILTYLKPLGAVEQFLAEHVAFLDDCYAKNLLIASGRRVPRNGGILLAPAGDRAALEQLLDRDPFKREGIAEFVIHEFVPSKFRTGFDAFLD